MAGPDLCDRFYEMLNQLSDVAALRQRLRELASVLRCAVLENAGPTRSEASQHAVRTSPSPVATAA